MKLPLDANIALSGLPLGASKEDVRLYFGVQPQPFKRTPISNEGDYWPSLGAFAYYDDAERLQGLELAAEACPTLSGQTLTSMPLQQVKYLLRKLDPELEEDDGGAISRHLGLSVWSGAGARGVVQAVLRFAPGYYD